MFEKDFVQDKQKPHGIGQHNPKQLCEIQVTKEEQDKAAKVAKMKKKTSEHANWCLGHDVTLSS